MHKVAAATWMQPERKTPGDRRGYRPAQVGARRPWAPGCSVCAVERRVLEPPLLRVDLRQTPCATRLACAGAYQLTLDSAAAELGIELHSVYAGQRLAGYAATSHLAVVKGQPPRVFCAPTDAPDAGVGEHRRDCLLDHFDQLSALIAGETGGAVRIDIAQTALDLMDATGAGPSTAAKDRGSAGH